MSFPQGIAFRDTAGYVTDGANDYAIVSSTGAYPVVSTQGNNVGYVSTTGIAGTRDRFNTNDPRIAGAHFNGSGAILSFKIALPSAGNYKVRLAIGDGGSYGQAAKCEVFDNTTSLGVLSSTNTTAAQRFRDALNAEYTNVTWPGSNSLSASLTFATTTCIFKIGDGTNQTDWAYIYIESAGGGTQSFSYTAAGGIVFAGAAPKLSKRVNAAAGGITFAGTAPYSSSGLQTRTVTPSGGITFAGAVAQMLKRVNTAAGGITFAGAAAQILKRVNTAAGGITFAGIAAQIRKHAVAAAGGITFGGAATVTTHIAKLIVTAAGGITFGGAAAVSYVGRVARDFIIRMRRRRL